MVKVTVLMSTYNGIKFLKECLDSIFNQTLKDIQVVIVDDASTDETWELLQEYKERYTESLILLRNEKNLYRQNKYVRISAIPFIKGEYVFQIDQDDTIEPELLECLYLRAVETDADAVYADYRTIIDGEKSKELYVRIPDIFTGQISNDKRCGLLLAEGMIWGAVIRTTLFAKIIQEMVRGIDVEISTRIYLGVTKIEKIEESAYCWRQVTGSASRSEDNHVANRMFEESAMAIINLIEAENDILIKKALWARYARYFYTNNVMRCLNLSNNESGSRYICELNQKMRRYYPNWVENDWVKDRLDAEEYDLSLLAYQNPEAAVAYADTYGVNRNCVYVGKEKPKDYKTVYRRYSDKLEQLKKMLQNERVAVWGAGERGIAFVEMQHDWIDVIIDNSELKQGKMFSGIVVHKIESVANQVDVILVTNSGWYKDIKQAAHEQNCRLKVVDVEVFLRYPHVKEQIERVLQEGKYEVNTSS